MSTYNPIARAELNKQPHRTSRRAWQHLIGVFPVLATAIALDVIAIVLLSAATGFDLVKVSQPLAVVLLYLLPRFVLLPVTVIFTVWLWLRTLILASQTIAREKQNGTWDLLLLTGISPRRLLIGKWWALMRQVWGSGVALFLMRLALTFFYAVENRRFYLDTFSTPWSVNAYPYQMPPQLPELLLTSVLIALFTLIGVSLTAAIGVLASLLLRRGALALVLAICIGMALPLLGCAALFLNALYWFNSIPNGFYNYGTWEWTMGTLSIYSAFSMVDNGTLTAVDLAQGTERLWYYSRHHNFTYLVYYPYRLQFASMILAFSVNSLLLYLLLLVAQRIVRYQGALPP